MSLPRRIYHALRSSLMQDGIGSDCADDWPLRTRLACECPDNAQLPRCPGAGEVEANWQRMHNGQVVAVDGYYGRGITQLMIANRGCHEPQEELVFAEVIRRAPPNAHMLELGSYWSFYSMWFLQHQSRRSAWLVEPDRNNLQVGVANFTRNGLTGWFMNALVGSVTKGDGPTPTVCVDDLLSRMNVQELAILHADVQGAEKEMLLGAMRSLQERRIAYVFISTHSEALHESCLRTLKDLDYRIDADVTPAQSYSFDGLIVGVRAGADEPPLPVPSRRGFAESVSLRETS